MLEVVQFISFDSFYNERLQAELRNNRKFNHNFELLSINITTLLDEFDLLYKKRQSLNKFQKLIYYVKFNKYLRDKYANLKGAVVNLQFVTPTFLFLLPFISNTFSKIILSYWGSDLLRCSRLSFIAIKPLIKKANIITFETEEVRRIFLEKMHNMYKKYENKTQIVKFGISLLDNIDRIIDDSLLSFANKYKIDRTRKCIAIGYNRGKFHQHIKILNSIINSGIDKNKIFVVFPWTYGTIDEKYQDAIKNTIGNRYDYVFLDAKLTDDEIACLRKISDMLIQVQTTDSFSSTMLETLYAGNEVITGSWLPYNEIYDRGIIMRSVRSVEEVGNEIKNFLEKPLEESVKNQNKKLIYQMSSWENNIMSWVNLY